MAVLSALDPRHWWASVVATWEFFVFLVRGTCIALGDFWVQEMRVGRVWKERSDRAPSMEQRDLVMQLSAQSPSHSRLCSTDELLHFNKTFVDRGLWTALSEESAKPSVVVTGVSYGGIGFYTALHLMLCGVNVHGVVRSANKAMETQLALQAAVDRQCSLHKEWAGRVGRIMIHLCDMSDTAAVVGLADKLMSDPNMRVIVCNAGSMSTPLKLSPQNLEEEFATHHVGHSVLLLRLLESRFLSDGAGGKLKASKSKGAGKASANPHPPSSRAGAQSRWRIIITSSGAAATADPTDTTTFHEWKSVGEMQPHISRFSAYGNAKMCELLFAFALARQVAQNPWLAARCTVNVLHPGPIRSRVIPNSQLPLRWLLDGEMAALFRMSPIIASLYVTDLCLSARHASTTGHFFRMGEDQSVFYARMLSDARQRRGFFTNSTLFPGIPGPLVSLSAEKQDALWQSTLSYCERSSLIEGKLFR